MGPFLTLMALTPKQATFVEEYLKDLNATQACIRAGYSARNADKIGPELLGHSGVAMAISEAIKARSARTEITQDMVIKELAVLAFADMRNYADVEDGGGVTVKTFDQMPEGATKAIKKIKERRRLLSAGEGDGDNVILDSNLELEHHDKLKALELLGKHLGMFKEQVQLTGAGDTPPVKVEFVRPDKSVTIDI